MQLSRLRASLSTVWVIAGHELRMNARLFRMWLFVAFALFVAITNWLNSFDIYGPISTISSAAFLYSPYLIPRLIFPDFQTVLTFGAVFLAFDLVSRDKRAKLDEVIGSMPISNSELVFGRALGIASLLFGLTVAFVSLYSLVGLISDFALPDVRFTAPELFSTLAVLTLDAFPYLLFWTAIVMFTTVVVRVRAIAAAIGIGLILLSAWAQNNAPMYLLDLLGTYSTSTRVPSEIAPVFTTTTIVWHRVAVTVFAAALLCWTALLYPRLDGVTRNQRVTTGILLTTLAGFGYAIVHYQHVALVHELDAYRAVHEKVLAEPQRVDVEFLFGSVVIQPGERISIDLTLDLHATRNVAIDQPLYFSLNPAYEIHELTVNDDGARYAFDDGLLSVRANAQFARGERLQLQVVAVGDPNANFAFLDASLDRLNASAVDAYMSRFLGDQASINHDAYVALTPGVAWYPIPGAHLGHNAISIHPRDFFHVNLDVLVPSDWHVAGPGAAIIEDLGNRRAITFAPPARIHEVGLFAAPFERRSLDIEGIEFELLVTPEHIEALDVFTPTLDSVTAHVSEKIVAARKLGFEYPFESYAIVEAPTYLRTYGGGWLMPSTQSYPGVFVLREGTLLQADFRSAYAALEANDNLATHEIAERQFALLQRYFENDITGSDIYAAFTKTLFAYQTQPTGPRAERLSLTLDYLLEEVMAEQSSLYSVHTLKDATGFIAMQWSMINIYRGWTQERLDDIFIDAIINRPSVWEHLLANSHTHSTAMSEAQDRLHAAYLFRQNMGELLLGTYGREQIAAWLAETKRRYEGSSFTFEEFVAVGRELNVDTQRDFGDWLREINLAAFVAQPIEIVRLPDADDGAPVYESSFVVQNDARNTGTFIIEYAANEQLSANGYTYLRTAPIKLRGKTGLEISLHTESPVSNVRLVPFFSENRTTFEVPVARTARIPDVSRERNPFTRAHAPVVSAQIAIIVDDLDAGFSVDPEPEDDDFFMPIRMIMFTQLDRETAGMDKGLRAYGGFAPVGDSEWSRQQVDTAFGKYRKTLVRAPTDATLQNVHFDAKLPYSGSWSLSYHLPVVGDASEQQYTSNRYQLRLEPNNAWSDYDVRLAQGERHERIDFDGSSMRGGWNELGVYELDASTVRVSVSTQARPNRTVVADAIRWEPVRSP